MPEILSLPNLINFYYFLKDNFFVCEIVTIVVERKWASHTRSWVYGQGQTWMEPFIIKYTFFRVWDYYWSVEWKVQKFIFDCVCGLVIDWIFYYLIRFLIIDQKHDKFISGIIYQQKVSSKRESFNLLSAVFLWLIRLPHHIWLFQTSEYI